MPKRLFLIIILLLLPCAHANTYYVATNGSNSNPGTFDSPWLTIQKAANNMAAGDTVYVRNGTYKEKVTVPVSGTSPNYITYSNYPNENVIVDEENYTRDSCFSITNKDYIKIIGFTLIGAATAGLYVHDGSDHIIADNLTVNNSKYGIRLQGDTTPVTYVTINHSILTNSQIHGLFIYNKVYNSYVEHTHSYNNGQGLDDGYGFEVTTDFPGLQSDGARNITIYGNEANDNLVQGIRTWNAVGVLIENNYAHENGATGIQIEDGSENIIVRNNTCEYNAQTWEFETGAWVDSSNNVLVEDNVFVGNKIGFQLGYSNHTIVRNNFIAENSRGVPDQVNAMGLDVMGDVDNGMIVHNTFYHNGNATSGHGAITLCNDPSYRIVFKNNIETQAMAPKDIDNSCDNINLTSDYNIYNNTRALSTYYFGSTYNWNNYRIASGQESHSKTANPNLTDPAERDFSISANSPAVDAGTFLTQASSAGSGTEISVDDASYFTDGMGMIGGDLIEIQNKGIYRVTGVDYEANTLTINESADWNEGDNISYPYFGDKPDIGAYEYILSSESDLSSPGLTLNSPAAFYNSTSGQVNFSCLVSDDIDVQNVSLFGNWSSGWMANETISSGLNNAVYNFTKAFSDGSYKWNCYACDNSSNCAFAVSNYTFIIDTTAPSIQNLTNSSITNQSIILSWQPNEAANYTLKYGKTLALSDGVNTSASFTISESVRISGLPNNTVYYFNITSCDRVGNCRTQGMFNFTTANNSNLDSTVPTIALNNPINVYNSTSNLLNFSCLVSDNIKVQNVTLYGNWSSGWVANETIASGLNNTLYNFTKSISDGKYKWNCLACDNSSNCASASSNNTFTIDTIAPTVQNLTNSSITNQSLILSWQTNESSNYTLKYGKTLALGGGSNTSFAFALSSAVRLSGLINSTLYYYNITSCDILGNCRNQGIYNFTTAQNTTSNPPTYGPAVSEVAINPLNPNISSTLECNATPIDADNMTLTIEWFWYNNSVMVLSGNHTGVVNNTNTVIATISAGNLSIDDIWNCTIRAFDGETFSGFASFAVTIESYLPCTESWSCTTWSSCSNGLQTRECSDANTCGTANDMPALSKSCSSSPGTGGSGGGGGGGSRGGYVYTYPNTSNKVNSSDSSHKISTEKDKDSSAVSNTSDLLENNPDDEEYSTIIGNESNTQLESPRIIGFLKDSHAKIALLMSSLILCGTILFFVLRPTVKPNYDGRLSDYITKANKAGLTGEEIKSKLITAGWNEKIVGRYFKK